MIYGGVFDIPLKKEKINSINKDLSSPTTWKDSKKMEKLNIELSNISQIVDKMENLKLDIESLKQFNELNTSDMDSDLLNEFEKLYNQTKNQISEEEILTYLNKEFDNNNAIFEIHAGAGGTESCDWALMLSRMYTRYFEKKGYKYEVIDEQQGEETGIKSITYLVKGALCYGYLKNEKGVHRLVRLSPFDSNNRRHTSFAAVDVVPEFDNSINIEIKDSDLKIDVYRSSGAGGQGVNTTDSAVRVTHIPTKIVVTCQNERSQIKNKEIAINILKSKLYQIKIREQKDKINSIKSDHNEIEFGSQIRSYVMHPYSLVKDHRTGYETSNVAKVLDGDIEEFIKSNLKGVRNNEFI